MHVTPNSSVLARLLVVAAATLPAVGRHILPHNRRVYDVSRLEPAGLGGNRSTNRNRPPADRLGLDAFPVGPLQCPGDIAPHSEMVVSGVDQRVHFRTGDIPR